MFRFYGARSKGSRDQSGYRGRGKRHSLEPVRFVQPSYMEELHTCCCAWCYSMVSVDDRSSVAIDLIVQVGSFQ